MRAPFGLAVTTNVANLYYAPMCFVFLRFDDIDPETGIEMKQSFSETIKDVYPIHIVESTDGTQGSCEFISQRTDVTKHIRSKSFTPLVNLQEVLERFV